MLGRQRVPSEFSEVAALAAHLRTCKIFSFAIPNGGERPIEAARKASMEGVLEGVSDYLILDPPPNPPEENKKSGKYCPGTFLEMKRIDLTLADVPATQIEFLRKVKERGFAAVVGFGARDAIKKLRLLGYPV